MKEEESLISLNSDNDIFDKIQQEFISKAISNAEKIVRAFNTKYDGAFDYSIRSLNVLDSLIEDFSDFADFSDEEIIDDFCAQAGSYILEVARRNYGGVYFWEDKMKQPMLKTGLPDFEISILTFEKVKNRIVNGDEDNIPYFFKGFSECVRKAEKGNVVTFG
ncbi:hypothetical protein [Fluviicola chungangensis]|uniref:hypothetical protein n=1 Tax=Fluviicola chungangensis TaxID=2597671 RepID=UPI001C923F06|nr:hypothetical protein [Fluviicola chungangensis]